jgi:DNA-binding IclR family transcriptional regulator
MSDSPTDEVVHTTETSLEIVDALQKLDAARIDEIADELDVAPSTVYRHLQTLRKHRYVVKEADFYRLGLQFLTIGGYVRERKGEYELAKDVVEDLAEQTQERVQFEVEEQGERVFIYTATGKHAVQAKGTIGRRGPLHCSAAGKAILAELPDSRVNTIIDQHGLESVTENTITDVDTLFEELEKIRERGIAFNLEESTVGLRAVAASVTTPDNEVLGALSISGPAHRMEGEQLEEEIPTTLRGLAQELELNIKYSRKV